MLKKVNIQSKHLFCAPHFLWMLFGNVSLEMSCKKKEEGASAIFGVAMDFGGVKWKFHIFFFGF